MGIVNYDVEFGQMGLSVCAMFVWGLSKLYKQISIFFCKICVIIMIVSVLIVSVETRI